MKLRKMFRLKKQDKTKIIAVVGACFFVFCLVGFLGFVTSLGSLCVIPFLFGLAQNDGRTATQKIGDWWGDRSRMQKLGIGIGFVLLIPFLLVGLGWMLVMGTAFALDIIIVLPVALAVGFFIFRNKRKEPDAHIVARFFGHPAVGVIGIIGVMVIIMMAGLNYQEYHRWDNARTNFSDYASPLHTTVGDTDTQIIPFYNETSGNWENQTVITPKVTGVLIFHVVDDYFNQAGFMTNLESDSDPDNTTIRLQDTDGFVDVNNAGISLASLDNQDGVSIINIGGYTDTQGLISFAEVPYGIYEMTIDAHGYQKFNTEIHINETYEGGTVFIHLKPIYYKIGVSYWFDEEVQHESTWVFYGKEYAYGHVSLEGRFLGGISQSDWDNMRRQNSWYGWTGLAVPSFTNSMLKVNHQLKNQLNVFWIPIIVAVAFIGTGTAYASQETEEEIIYGAHTLRVDDLSVIDAQRFEYPTFWRQLPTANSLIVDSNESRTTDVFDTSCLHHREYEYVVWAEAPSGNDIRIEFNVTTHYTLESNSQLLWSVEYGHEQTPITTWDEVEVVWQNVLPTVETPILG